MSDFEEDMPMLGEEEEEEEDVDDELLEGDGDEDEFQDDGDDGEENADGDHENDMDLEDMLAEELDEEEDEEDPAGADGLTSPTGGQTEPESVMYTEGDDGDDGDGGDGGDGGDVDEEGHDTREGEDMAADGDGAQELGGQGIDGRGMASPTSTAAPPDDRAEENKGKSENKEDDEIQVDDEEDDRPRSDEEDDEGASPVEQQLLPDVHQQFALLLADPSTPRLPSDPSIIDVSRLTIEQRKVYNAKVMSLLTEDQLDRYECFRRSSLKEPMRRLVQVIVGGTMPKATDKIIVAMAGVGKVFVGELVEEARRIAEERGERGALRKETVMEAFFRVRGAGEGGNAGSGRKRRKVRL